jgi:mannose-6-phosphate isomerase-like protein (cupin superfamily)
MAAEKTEFGTVEVLERDKDASFTLETVLAGKCIPKHCHKKRDEIVLVLEGHTRRLKEGNIYLFRKGEPHEYVNDSDKPLKLLLIMTPPYNGGDYFTR